MTFWDDVCTHIDRLEKENTKLREVLEFYAEGNSHYDSKYEWGPEHQKELGQETVPSGAKARKVLNEL